MKKLALTVCIVATIVGIVYFNLSQGAGGSPFDFGGAPAVSVNVAPASHRAISSRVTAPGRIAAAQRVEIYSNVPGQVESIEIAPGDSVKPQQPLLRLSSKKIETELRRAQLSHERSASDLQEAATNLESARGSYESKKRQLDLYSDAKGSYDQAVINERLSEAKLKQAQKLWEKWAGKEGRIVGQEVWQAKNAYENATIEFDLAKSRTKAAEAKVTTVELASQDEVDSYKSKFEAAQSRHASISKSVKEAEETLALSQQEVDKLTIHTPIGGTVTRVTVVVGEFVTPGAMNSPGTVVVTVADLDTLLVEADVDETDVLAVRTDQKSMVTCDALQDERFPGTVIEVAGAGQKETGSEIAIFPTKIRLDSKGDQVKRLRPGLSAHVEIETATHAKALAVPLQSVVERPASRVPGAGSGEEMLSVVFVVSNSRANAKKVKVGLSDDTHIEILDGLSAGDEVIVGPYRAFEGLQDGARVSVAKREE